MRITFVGGFKGYKKNVYISHSYQKHYYEIRNKV